MKLYALNMWQPRGQMPPQDVLEKVMMDVRALRLELEDAEAWVFGAGLCGPETSTVLRPQGDQVIATDGPYVDGGEYVGGMTIIKVPDLDAALMWGHRYVRVTGLPVEVRPFWAGV
ncbi:YciI family protein [Actinomadura fibrosa]|uniref:YciI family protein n=1 Tax=Actinomadura fibrosa TaxID=111802 RepID=A0ABW2XYW4_9ACTN|nr:YciI family protein [Actinomadura fibrosa]